jgi:GT2 family glycosyltransferase
MTDSIATDTQPLISVVMVNFNRRDDLREAILSVRSQDYERFEIIVVDNASSDDSVAMLRSEFPEVRLIRLDRNIGMEGYSVGFANALGELLFQMDNDSLMPDPHVLSQVAEAFRVGDERLAILATRVEELRASGETIETLRRKSTETGYRPTTGYHAGGVAFKKSLMDQVGYYNESVFLYGAELFVQMQALAAGFSLCYAPAIFMIHKGSGVARSAAGVYYELRNRYWFMRHFGTRWQQVRYLPQMLLHDTIYSLHRGGLKEAFRAIRDGFGQLPASLIEPQSRNSIAYIKAIDQTGAAFGLTSIASRLVRQLKSRGAGS